MGFLSEDSGVLGCADKVSVFPSSLLSTPAKSDLTVDCIGSEDNVNELECLKEKRPKSAPCDLNVRSPVIQKNTFTAKRAWQR